MVVVVGAGAVVELVGKVDGALVAGGLVVVGSIAGLAVVVVVDGRVVAASWWGPEPDVDEEPKAMNVEMPAAATIAAPPTRARVRRERRRFDAASFVGPLTTRPVSRD
jgi:hypothetical protein